MQFRRGVRLPGRMPAGSCVSAVEISVPEPGDHGGNVAESIPGSGRFEIADADGMTTHFIDGLETHFIGGIVTDEHRGTSDEFALLHEQLNGATLIEAARHELVYTLSRTHDECLTEFRDHLVHDDFDFRRESRYQPVMHGQCDTLVFQQQSTVLVLENAQPMPGAIEYRRVNPGAQHLAGGQPDFQPMFAGGRENAG